MNMNMNDPMQNDTINMGNNQFVPSNNMNTMDNNQNNSKNYAHVNTSIYFFF